MWVSAPQPELDDRCIRVCVKRGEGTESKTAAVSLRAETILNCRIAAVAYLQGALNFARPGEASRTLGNEVMKCLGEHWEVRKCVERFAVTDLSELHIVVDAIPASEAPATNTLAPDELLGNVPDIMAYNNISDAEARCQNGLEMSILTRMAAKHVR